MKLKYVILKAFRLYKQETKILLDDLTAFIGKNDSGKSSVLEALNLFFDSFRRYGEGRSLYRVWGDSPRDYEEGNLSVTAQNEEMVVGVVFCDVPEELISDTGPRINISDTYLLNANSELELRQTYSKRGRRYEATFSITAYHPIHNGLDSELSAREIEQYTDELGLRHLPATEALLGIKQALWKKESNIQLSLRALEIYPGKLRWLWEAIGGILPQYFLFGSDVHRDSRSFQFDRLIQESIMFASGDEKATFNKRLEEIKNAFQHEVQSSVEHLLGRVSDANVPGCGNFRVSVNTEEFERILRVSLTDDEGIPLSKRGSGAKRLLLLALLRAQIEPDAQTHSRSLIYALDEPENSQHPSQQEKVAQELVRLSELDNCQVVLTTHNPAFAHLLPLRGLRHVRSNDGQAYISYSSETITQEIVSELGILPDTRIRIIVCVEGPNDISFLKAFSRILSQRDSQIPDFNLDPRFAFVPTGGSTLRDWVNQRFLQGFNRPEIHLYDRDLETPPRYQQIIEKVNARRDGLHSYAALTTKRELENYLHPDAIFEDTGYRLSFGDFDDVPEILARALYANAAKGAIWSALGKSNRERKISAAKKVLNQSTVQRMTYERIIQADNNGDLLAWFRKAGMLASGFNTVGAGN